MRSHTGVYTLLVNVQSAAIAANNIHTQCSPFFLRRWGRPDKNTLLSVLIQMNGYNPCSFAILQARLPLEFVTSVGNRPRFHRLKAIFTGVEGTFVPAIFLKQVFPYVKKERAMDWQK